MRGGIVDAHVLGRRVVECSTAAYLSAAHQAKAIVASLDCDSAFDECRHHRDDPIVVVAT